MGACSPFWFGHFSQHQVSRTKTGDVLSRNLWLLCCSCFAAEMCVGQGLCRASLPYWPARVSSGRKARAVPQCACSAQRTRRMHWGRQPFHLQMRTTARPHNQRELLSYRAWSEAGQSATGSLCTPLCEVFRCCNKTQPEFSPNLSLLLAFFKEVFPHFGTMRHWLSIYRCRQKKNCWIQNRVPNLHLILPESVKQISPQQNNCKAEQGVEKLSVLKLSVLGLGYLLAGHNVRDKIRRGLHSDQLLPDSKMMMKLLGPWRPTAELQAEASCLCGQLVWGRMERGNAAGPKDWQPKQEERRRDFCAHQITIRVSSCTAVLLLCCYSCDGLAVFLLRRTGFCLHDEQRLQNKSYSRTSADCPHWLNQYKCANPAPSRIFVPMPGVSIPIVTKEHH